MSADRPLTIAGAGVAGLTAAITLARAGRAVRLVERARASGLHRSPDWDAIENWTSTEDMPRLWAKIGVDENRFEHAGFHNFSVIDLFGRRYDIHTQRPFFYLVKRGATEGGLERGMQAQAAALGVDLAYGATCARENADIWAAGGQGPRAQFVSTGFTFRTDHPDWVYGIVDWRVAPRAYAYLVVIRGEGTLAVVLTEQHQRANECLDQAHEIFLKHTELSFHDVKKSGGSGGDLGLYWTSRMPPAGARREARDSGDAARSTRGVRGGANAPTRQPLVIGEAAGFQDYLWGFGIRQAFVSGYWAAQSILTGEEWAAVARREIRPIVEASIVNRWVYDRLPNRANVRFVRYFSRQPDLNASIGYWYHPRWLHRLLWPVVERHLRPQ